MYFKTSWYHMTKYLQKYISGNYNFILVLTYLLPGEFSVFWVWMFYRSDSDLVYTKFCYWLNKEREWYIYDTT